MTTKTRKTTAVAGMAILLLAATLCSYGEDTTTGNGPAAWIGKAQSNHQAWQAKALSGGGIEPAATRPATDVIRHQTMIAFFDELFAQLTDVMNMLRLAILATK